MDVTETRMGNIRAPAVQEKRMEGFHISVRKQVSLFDYFVEMLFRFRGIRKQRGCVNDDILPVLEYRSASEAYIFQKVLYFVSKG